MRRGLRGSNPAVLAAILSAACRGGDSERPILTSQDPIKLEAHLEAATVQGSASSDGLRPLDWTFGAERPEWEPVAPLVPDLPRLMQTPLQDGTRFTLSEEHRVRGFGLLGLVQVDVDGLHLHEWDYVEVTARAGAGMRQLGLVYNYSQEDPVQPALPFENIGALVSLVPDGTIQTYRLPVHGPFSRAWRDPWRQLGIAFSAQQDDGATLDVLSVTLMPRSVPSADASVGVTDDPREHRYGRRAIYARSPSRLEFDLTVPVRGRFVTDMGVLGSDVPISFRVAIRERRGEEAALLTEVLQDPSHLHTRVVDLSEYSGSNLTLVLETGSDSEGEVAVWGAPTIAAGTDTHDADGGFIDPPSYRLVTPESGERDWTVSFSPDGDRLVFARSGQLFVIRVAGGPMRGLLPTPPPVEGSRMDWSRRDLIAFSGWTPEEGASIWLVKPDGSDLRRITSSKLSQDVMYPSWYPDGNALAVVDYQARGAAAVLKRIELGSLAVQDLTNPDEIIAGKPSVSPDGRSVAFAGRRPGTPGGQSANRIWIVQERQLRELDAEQGRTPAWSPDGGWIAFESNRGSPNGHYALFVMPAQGGVATQLTSFEVNANHPAWSPDGSHIAFSVAPDLENMWRIAILDVPLLQVDGVAWRPRP